MSLLHECLNQPFFLYSAAANPLHFNINFVPTRNFAIHATASKAVYGILYWKRQVGRTAAGRIAP